MLKRIGVVAVGLAVFTWNAAAQTSLSSQTSASGSNQSSVSANESGAQVNSNSSANAAQNANVVQNGGNNSAAAKASGSAHNSSSAGASTSDVLPKGSAGASTSSALSNGSTINAVLTKPVDCRKAKAGDEVVAKTTSDIKSDGSVVPKGSEIVGHVTEAKVKEKGDAASKNELGLVFDHALLRNGQEVPMHAVIQAMASAQQSAMAAAGPLDAAESAGGYAGGMTNVSAPAGGGGGLLGGVGSTVGATAGTVTSAASNVGATAGGVVNTGVNAAGSATGAVHSGLDASGRLTQNATGMIGMAGMTLTSQAAAQASGAVQSSVISSSHNIRLDSGTQMLLKVTGE